MAGGHATVCRTGHRGLAPLRPSGRRRAPPGWRWPHGLDDSTLALFRRRRQHVPRTRRAFLADGGSHLACRVHAAYASPAVADLLQIFAVAFTRPTFAHARVLVFGTILATGQRTVAAALRAVGLRDERHF